MKTLLCLLAAALCVPLAVRAQITTPPVKMGRWRTTSTVTMTGLNLPPDVAARLQAMGQSIAQPHTMSILSCLTPDKWQKVFNNSQRNQNCQYSNQQMSSSAMSTDMTCTSSDGRHNTTGHIEVTFVSDEKMQGKVHMESHISSQSQPTVIDSTFQGVYQGADCQGISPDSPKIDH